MTDVLSIGETMVMFVAEAPGPLATVERFSKRLAGADSNVAIGLARLGLRVAWVSRLGRDSFGDYVRACIAREGVDCSQVALDAQRSTGFMLKSRAERGADPLIEYHRRGSAASVLSVRDVDPALFRNTRHLHATGVFAALSDSTLELVEHAMRAVRDAGGSVSFDPNLRPTLFASREQMVSTINRVASLAHWVLPGLDEGRVLSGCDTPDDIAAFYLQRGVETVVVKLGAAGAYYRSAHESGHAPGVRVERVVDTVGAGDGFAVGVISARLEGLSWPQALARGNWIGAQAIQVIGDMEGLPRRAQLPPVS
jgi:dehydrogluconokinase